MQPGAASRRGTLAGAEGPGYPGPMAHPQSSVPAHARATLRLGLPLIGSHLAQMALHVTDTIMVGWYGVAALAAVVLGASSFFVVFILGAGFAQAVMPLVAGALGQGDEAQVRRATRMGLWLSVAYGVASYPLFWWSGPILLALGQQPEVAALGQDYMRIAGAGMIPALLVMVLKSHLAALERTQVVLWVTVAGVAVNAAVNWALIFGNWGAPELGVEGAAIASVLTQGLTFAALALYAAMCPGLSRFRLFQRFWRADPAALARVFRLGLPIGFTSLAESSLFQATAVMMGWIGTVELAAHGIALELAALTFMVHVGLSNAATIRVGRFHGAADAGGLRRAGIVAVGLSMGLGLLAVALFLAMPAPLVSIFLDEAKPESAAILGVGVSLLTMAALFQMADAAQVMALGLLRGVQDTKVPMVIAIVSYWAVGMPAAYGLAFGAGLGADGLWLGLVAGLTVAAGLLMWRFWSRAPRPA